MRHADPQRFVADRVLLGADYNRRGDRPLLQTRDVARSGRTRRGSSSGSPWSSPSSTRGRRSGVVPAASARAIRERAKAPTPARVAEIERTTNHDVAAFVDAVALDLGADGRWFHYGLTSSDVARYCPCPRRPTGGRVDQGRARASARRCRGPRRGASQDAHHRPDPRSPRRADDVRAEAPRLGVPARA